MNPFNRPNAKAFPLLIFSLCLLFISAASFAFSSSPPTEKQANELGILRQAGIQGNRSQIPALVTGLRNPAHRFYKFTALRSLAQMGASETLPQITDIVADAQAPGTKDSNLANFATVARARLLAESATRDIADGKDRTSAKISRFLNEIDLPAADINAAAAEYHKGWLEWQRLDGPPLAVYALREIADILYQAQSVDAADLSLVAGLNFADDPPSALKIRLAQIPRMDRLNVLVQELAHSKVSYGDGRYEMQLVADEGPEAGHAVITQLEVMDAHRKQYPGSGFTMLFRTLDGIGEKELAPSMERLMNEPDGFMKYYAGPVVSDVELGNRCIYAPGY